jgi:hypothetical protein
MIGAMEWVGLVHRGNCANIGVYLVEDVWTQLKGLKVLLFHGGFGIESRKRINFMLLAGRH